MRTVWLTEMPNGVYQLVDAMPVFNFDTCGSDLSQVVAPITFGQSAALTGKLFLMWRRSDNSSHTHTLFQALRKTLELA